MDTRYKLTIITVPWHNYWWNSNQYHMDLCASINTAFVCGRADLLPGAYFCSCSCTWKAHNCNYVTQEWQENKLNWAIPIYKPLLVAPGRPRGLCFTNDNGVTLLTVLSSTEHVSYYLWYSAALSAMCGCTHVQWSWKLETLDKGQGSWWVESNPSMHGYTILERQLVLHSPTL